MSEVAKMFENAGIEKCNSSLKDIMPDICLKNNKDENCKCKDCEHNLYPNFTAVKQLELIKWLAVKGDFDSSIDIAKNTYDYWTIYFQGARWTADGFEESLAGLINNLWQDLTEQERTEIRRILK